MKKINKTIVFATQYANWYKECGHDISYISNQQFYNEVLAELLICQDGLCAYTEKELLSQKEINDLRNNFCNHVSLKFNEREHIQIEHFDSTLKKADGWNWNNLFAVYSVINKAKNVKPVDTILKPDAIDYEANTLLDYDCKEHIFFAHPELNDSIVNRVNKMIEVLGLNHRTIKSERKKYIRTKLMQLDNEAEHEFPTALNICRSRNKY